MSPHTVVTVTGNLTADPALRYTREGAPFTTFSVAFNRSYYDRDAARWQQSGTDFYDVTAFGALGLNVLESAHKGDPVVVHGRLRLEDWQTEDKHGTRAKIQADAVGFDMTFGQGSFTRVKRPAMPSNDPMDDPEVRSAGLPGAPDPGQGPGPDPDDERADVADAGVDAPGGQERVA